MWTELFGLGLFTVAVWAALWAAWLADRRAAKQEATHHADR